QPGAWAPSYLTSTFAPTSSNFFLMAAASSLGTPSLIGFGAPSTRSLASLRPSAVISRTTLMTLILLVPTSVSVTVKSVFSSAGAAAAAPPPPPGIAIGIAAAAETPSSDSSVFTSCDSSSTLIPLMYSTTCCCVTSAIVLSPQDESRIPNPLTNPYAEASWRFFSACTSTLIKSRGAAFSTLTIWTIGACSRKSSFAYSSGLPGSAASSVTSAGFTARPWTIAALIFSVGAVLPNVVSVLASATGSVFVYATAVVPSKNCSSGSKDVPLSARRASVFLTTL